MFVGGVGSAISTILLYAVPTHFGPDGMFLTMVAGGFYGVTLAGYVPLSALMPYLAPENKAAAMSMLNLGAGMIPIGLFADLIDGLGDPRIAREGGETPGFVT